MANKKGITVLVADRHSVTRAGVKAILRGCKVVEADNGRDAVKMVKRLKPEIAVMAVRMPKLNGLDAAHQVILAGSTTRIMLLTSADDDFTLARVNFIGVHGYLCKSSPIGMLNEAVKTLLSGQTWYEPVMRNYLARHAHMPNVNPTPLTSRELEIVQLVAEGYSNKDIASELGISATTSDKHRQNLMDKLNIHSPAGLTRYAILAGLVEAR